MFIGQPAVDSRVKKNSNADIPVLLDIVVVVEHHIRWRQATAEWQSKSEARESGINDFEFFDRPMLSVIDPLAIAQKLVSYDEPRIRVLVLATSKACPRS